MRKIITGAAAVLGLILTGVAPASAHHNVPEIDIEPGECEPTKLTATWPEEDHQVANAALVVKTAGEHYVADIGETIEVGPFDVETEVSYRVWGGGERDYDVPELDQRRGLERLLRYIDRGGSPTDADAPGVRWLSVVVDGCEPELETVIAEEPQSSDPICNEETWQIEPGSVTIPDQDGVAYELDGEAIEPGVHAVDPGTYTVTAHAEEGFELDGEASWDLTVADEPECTEPEGEPEPGEVTVEVISQQCELVEIEFVNGTDETVIAQARVDGDEPAQRAVEPGEVATFTVEFDEASGEHIIEYRVGDDEDWTGVVVDCGSPEATPDPDPTDESGDEDGADGGAAEDGGEAEKLPDTGSSVAWLGGAALLLVAGGAAMVALRRRGGQLS